jgi:hypothetical protein
MKSSSRVRSASQSVQPEERATPKRQKTAVVKPKEKAKMHEAIAEGASDVKEPFVEKPKKKAVEKAYVAEKKSKENKPVAPRVTVRKVGRCMTTPRGVADALRLLPLTKSPTMAKHTTPPHPRRRLELQLEVSAHSHPSKLASHWARPATTSLLKTTARWALLTRL